MALNIGDAEITFTAKTEALDKEMNELFDRIERTCQAARKAWNSDGSEVEGA
jgi:phage host-nuclease inhibitor protein Gam